MDVVLNTETIANSYSSMCASSSCHVMVMSQLCSRPFALLMHSELRKFRELPVPRDSSELQRRQEESIALSSKIGRIAHADSMARLHSRVRQEILEVTSDYCDRVSFDDSVQSESLILDATINSLCNANLMNGLAMGLRR